MDIDIVQTWEYTVLQPAGALTMRAVPEMRRALAKQLVEGQCVLVDLSQLGLERRACVQVFASALSQAGGWPAAKLALFGADAGMFDALVRSRVSDRMPLAETLPVARALAQARPALVRTVRELGCDPMVLRHVRAFVREACDVWNVPGKVRDDAVMIANELVSNAIEHAHTSARATLEYGRNALAVRVRDYSTGHPVRHGQHEAWAGGHGLAILNGLTPAWGVDEHPDGKTTWARLAALDEPDSTISTN